MNSSVVGVVLATPAAVDFWSPVVIALIPVLIMLFKRLIPEDYREERMMKVMYPMLSMVLGPLLDWAFTLVTSHQSGPHAVLFGLVAIGMREFGDQLRKTVAKPAALIVVVGLACAVSGCATGGGKPDVLGTISKFTIEDLQAAADDAKMHNDIVALDCWGILLGLAQGGVPAPPKIIGVATAIQAKRDLTGAAGQSKIGEVKRLVNRGCAALFVEENVTLMKLGSKAIGIPSLP